MNLKKIIKKPIHTRIRIGFVLKMSLLIFLINVGLVLSHYDLPISSYFYNGTFYLRENPYIRFIQRYSWLVIVFLYMWTMREYYRGKRGLPSRINYRQFKFLSISLFGWCIAFVHLIKFSFGRIRPIQASIFGGSFDFTPAFVFSNQCKYDCSFISGHTGVMAWLLAFSMVIPQKYRLFGYFTTAVCVILTALGRIMGGFHFISDIYFAMLFVAIGIIYTSKFYITDNKS